MSGMMSLTDEKRNEQKTMAINGNHTDKEDSDDSAGERSTISRMYTATCRIATRGRGPLGIRQLQSKMTENFDNPLTSTTDLFRLYTRTPTDLGSPRAPTISPTTPIMQPMATGLTRLTGSVTQLNRRDQIATPWQPCCRTAPKHEED